MEAWLFGKMPAHGDFVSRGIDDESVAAGDTVLTEAMAMAAHRWDADWEDVYVETPVWRFMATPGVFGPLWTAGVFLASVDAVGRQYPLVAGFASSTLALLAEGAATRAALDEAEAIARSALLELIPVDAAHERLDAVALNRFGGDPEMLEPPGAFAVGLLSRLEAKPWTPQSRWWVAGGGPDLRLLMDGALTREGLAQLFRRTAAPPEKNMGDPPQDAAAELPPSPVVSGHNPADPVAEPGPAGPPAEAETRG